MPGHQFERTCAILRMADRRRLAQTMRRAVRQLGLVTPLTEVIAERLRGSRIAPLGVQERVANRACKAAAMGRLG